MACRTSSEAEPKPPASEATEALNTAGAPSDPAQALVQAYLQLQTKLAHDDASGAKRAFAAVSAAAKRDDLALDPSQRQSIERACEQGAAAGELNAARAAFATLSTEMLRWIDRAQNPLTAPLSVAHCPMALDNKGARWLQLGEKIQNPYYGAEMLTCGSVEKTLAPRESR